MLLENNLQSLGLARHECVRLISKCWVRFFQYTSWLLMLVVGGSGSSAYSADLPYPNRPIRIIVPFASGGPSDIVARSLAQKLNQSWNLAVVVDNRIGASGMIGADLVAKSPPDGYTLLLAQVGDTISMSLFSKIPYHFEKDFAPIMQAGQTPFLLVAHPSLPVKTVKDLIQLAKARPGILTFGSSGSGSASHLAGELLKSMASIDMLHIPYKGQAPATTDLLGGQIALMFNNPITSLAHVKAQRLHALGVSTSKRFQALSEVPTLAESGVAGFDVGFWMGTLAPAGTPRNVIEKLNNEMVKIVHQADVLERFASLGIDPIGNSADEFNQVIHKEINRWAIVVKNAHIKAD